ncbi:MAG: restriction endonuclease [Candidatus Parcubacteria bacterium]|nr:restriction endonuclease [Candidatus Parcubacteria bacterium]
MDKKIYVINGAGDQEPLSEFKVYRSAKRSGASNDLAKQIVFEIQQKAYPGITTQEIHDRIKSFLIKEAPYSAMRFSLKEGIRKLGPTGFHFEKYVADIFEDYGYAVQNHQYLPGVCVNHEVDFLAKKEKKIFVGECKYHNTIGCRVDLKVVLANHSRITDLENGKFFKTKELKDLKMQGIVVTNTKFTTEAIKYTQCVGLDLLGWRHPNDHGLEYMIESRKLYPVTILPSLTDNFIGSFAEERIMLVKDVLVLDLIRFGRKWGIPESRMRQIKKEAELLMNSK